MLINIWKDYTDFYKNCRKKVKFGFLSNDSKTSRNSFQQKGDEILFNNMIVDTKHLPPVVPEGQYKSDVRFHSRKNVTYLLMRTFVSVKGIGKGADFKMG
jgi:hypothetical protein